MRMDVLLLTAILALGIQNGRAGTIFETGTLGPTGISAFDVSLGNPPGVNISRSVFSGVRFHLSAPVVTTEIGGHFAGPYSEADTFFGAIVRLTSEDDFPDSHDLSTPDLLGTTLLHFTEPSSEVYGDLSLQLAPGWYALVFGSGLFGATGHGAAVLNNDDSHSSSYFHWQAGALGDGWFDRDVFPAQLQYGFWYSVSGYVIPEPASVSSAGMVIVSWIGASYLRNEARARRQIQYAHGIQPGNPEVVYF